MIQAIILPITGQLEYLKFNTSIFIPVDHKPTTFFPKMSS